MSLTFEAYKQLYAEAWKIKDTDGKRSRTQHKEHLGWLLIDYVQRAEKKEIEKYKKLVKEALQELKRVNDLLLDEIGIGLIDLKVISKVNEEEL